jgi:hypothetical protein
MLALNFLPASKALFPFYYGGTLRYKAKALRPVRQQHTGFFFSIKKHIRNIWLGFLSQAT